MSEEKNYLDSRTNSIVINGISHSLAKYGVVVNGKFVKYACLIAYSSGNEIGYNYYNNDDNLLSTSSGNEIWYKYEGVLGLIISTSKFGFVSNTSSRTSCYG